MGSKDLKFFLEVAKTNSVSKAAYNLYSSQSNVSSHIKKIEDELNVNLFERTNKGVFLTKEGEKLLVYAENITTLMHEANNLFSSKRESFTIGTTQTLALTLPKHIHTLQQKFPNTSISIKILNDINDKEKSNLDCVITNSNKDFLTYKVLEILEELVVITPQSCQDIEDFINYPIIVNNISSCPYRNLLLNYLLNKTKNIPHIVEMDSIDGIIDLVTLESGISLIPKRLLKENQKLNVFPIEELSKITITVWLKEKDAKFGNDFLKLYKKEHTDFIL